MLIVNKGPSNFHMISVVIMSVCKSLLVANFFRHIKKKSTFPHILVIHNLNIWE